MGQFATDMTFTHIELTIPFREFKDMLRHLNEDHNRTMELVAALMKDGIATSHGWVRERSLGQFKTLAEVLICSN